MKLQKGSTTDQELKAFICKVHGSCESANILQNLRSNLTVLTSKTLCINILSETLTDGYIWTSGFPRLSTILLLVVVEVAGGGGGGERLLRSADGKMSTNILQAIYSNSRAIVLINLFIPFCKYCSTFWQSHQRLSFKHEIWQLIKLRFIFVGFFWHGGTVLNQQVGKGLVITCFC